MGLGLISRYTQGGYVYSLRITTPTVRTRESR